MTTKVYVTVYVERANAKKYRVVRVKNATRPDIDQVLSEDDVQSLINRGINVIIDIPRKRE